MYAREEKDKYTPPILEVQYKSVTLFDVLDKYTHPLPNKNLPNNRAVFVTGGLRFGGRYPDIIIDKGDFARGEKILRNIGITFPSSCNLTEFSITSIVNKVREYFHTEKAVKFEIDGEYVKTTDDWANTIDKSSKCLIEKVYDCTTDCQDKKKEYKNTTTNVTFLPYLIGDCREHAWLSGFLSELYHSSCCSRSGCDKKIRIFYTKVYICDDINHKLIYLEDHVFVLYITKNNVYIIDPLYADATAMPRIEYNKVISSPVNICTLTEYDGFNSFSKNLCSYEKDEKGNRYQPSVVMECGKIVTSSRIVRLINVPIIYDGSMSLIENTLPVDGSEGRVLNKIVNSFSLKNWTDFNDWCL